MISNLKVSIEILRAGVGLSKGSSFGSCWYLWWYAIVLITDVLLEYAKLSISENSLSVSVWDNDTCKYRKAKTFLKSCGTYSKHVEYLCLCLSMIILTVGKTNAIGWSPLRTDWLCSFIRTPEWWSEWWPFDDALRSLLSLLRCTCFML